MIINPTVVSQGGVGGEEEGGDYGGFTEGLEKGGYIDGYYKLGDKNKGEVRLGGSSFSFCCLSFIKLWSIFHFLCFYSNLVLLLIVFYYVLFSIYPGLPKVSLFLPART